MTTPVPTPPAPPSPAAPAPPAGPYPMEADHVIRQAAQEQGHLDALRALGTVRDMMIGDGGRVEEKARAWGTTPFLGDARDRVEGARTDLAAYWEGAAHETFDRYAEEFVRLTDANGAAHGEMSAALQRTVETVYFTYGTALRFMSACAGAILKAGGGLISKVMPWDWFGVGQVTGDALNEFARNIGDLSRDAIRQLGELNAQGVAFEAAAHGVSAPLPLPGAVPHVGNWHVSSAW